MKEGYQNGVKKYNVYTWDEVKQHDKPDDKWLVIDGKVYDITTWSKKHPGGAKVISHYAGDDATVSNLKLFYVMIFILFYNSVS